MSKFEVICGVEGCCLALDDTRIAGPKPWGGGTVIHVWETDKTYRAIDGHSRYFELFGTPERAAETMFTLMLNCARGDGPCERCPAFPRCNWASDDGEETENIMLEWLRGDA